MRYDLFVILLLLIVTFFHTPGRGVCALKLESAEIYEKSANVLGLELDYALMDLEFDDDLYKVKAGACPNYDCPALTTGLIPGCTCDYTDPNQCPKQRLSNCTNTCPTTRTSPFAVNYCTDLAPWTAVVPGEIQNFTVTDGRSTYIRYKANDTICESVYAIIYPIQGEVQVIGSWIPLIPSYRLQGRVVSGDVVLQLNICPSDNILRSASYTTVKATYFFEVVPLNDYAQFAFEIVSGVVAPTSQIPTGCVNITDHTCINDGQLMSGNTGDEQYTYYTYAVSTPQIVTIAAPAILKDIDFYVSDDPSNQYPSASNQGKWRGTNIGDDVLTLSLYPISATEPLILYIGLVTYYATKFQFTVTSQTQNTFSKITDLPPTAGAYSLAGTSRLIVNDGSFYCSKWDDCTSFHIQYPFTHNLPIWPIPSDFSTNDRFSDIIYTPANNPTQSASYKLSFLLSLKQGESLMINSDFETLLNSQIQFLSVLVDANGAAINSTYSISNIKQLACEYNAFIAKTNELDQFENTIFSTTSSAEMNNLVFEMNILTMSDEWTGCTNSANSLLESNSEVDQILSTYCPYLSNQAEFATDPCCNSSSTFFQCCVPRYINIQQVSYTGVNSDSVSAQCSSPECTTSVLNDYQNSLLSNSECDVPGYAQQNSQIEMREVLRGCKDLLQNQTCNSDSDCAGGYPCDLYSRVCLVPAVDQDKQYLTCVFNQLPKTYLFYFVDKYSLPNTIDSSFIDQVFQVFNMSDCTSVTGQYFRTYYTYSTTAVNTGRCYNSPNCLDLSCETVHDVCYDGYYSQWTTTEYNSLGSCPSIGFCNSQPCVGLNGTQCQTSCPTGTSFCGFCSTNSTQCYNFDVASDGTTTPVPEPTCVATDYCVLPNGEYTPGLSSTDCQASGVCDKPCGKQCTGYTGCVATTATSANCSGVGTFANGVCEVTSAQTQNNCTTLGYQWVDCPSSLFSECYSNTGSVNLCSVQDIACTTKEECEGTGGECSDSYFFNPSNVYYYPNQFGKCTHGHFNYQTNWPGPTCNSNTEHDSPVGCYPYLFSTSVAMNEQECTAQSTVNDTFVWWTPALTESACTARSGCQILDNYHKNNLPYNFRFNQMGDSQCGACGQDVFATYEPMFTWTPGVWSPGVYVKGQYLQSNFTHSTSTQTLLNYQQLYNDLVDSVNTHIADLFRSEALCRMERIENNLKSISCSCSSDGAGSSCFNSSTVILGQTIPCQSEKSEFYFVNGLIKFTTSSVTSLGCSPVLLSQVPQQLYKSKTVQSLSSSFVSYRKPDDYAVLNSKDAIIGTILSDGININSKGTIQSLTLCFTYSSQFEAETSTYPIFDFCLLQDNNTFSPMEIDTYIYYEMDNTTYTQIKYLCADIPITNSDESFFPIHRIDKWRSAAKETFDQSAKGMVYTLACLFSVVSVWGFFQLSITAYHKFGKSEKISMAHLLILFVTLFITIRAIYFFILPTGSLTNNSVADYVLVVLPTFIYFTSFTIIIVLWYVIVKTKQTGKSLKQKLNRFIIAINVILYILFIVIVLVFHFTESNPPDNCGGRIVVNTTTNNSQRAVSIVYATVQAVISLVMGAAFIYLGGSLYMAMKFKKDSSSSSTTSQQKKIFTITFACSVGFILHCVFVLILVGAEPSNIIFSFVGLIITEILPSLSILYSYNQGSMTKQKAAAATKSSTLKYIPSRAEQTSSRLDQSFDDNISRSV